MSEVLHANIFFFITGIAVIVFTSLLCVALFHFIKILKAIRRIVDRVEAGTANIADDIEHIRAYVMEESFFARFFRGARKREETPRSESRARQTPLRALKPDRKPKTELKIKNEG